MKRRKLYKLISSFALEQSDSFELDDLEQYIEKKDDSFDDLGLLYNMACESEWLFEDDRKLVGSFFVPRHCLFKGAEFRVKPLPEEVAGGYLVPGHRFMPFISRTICPVDATLKLADDSVATKRKESFSYEMALRFILYFGEYGMIDYLVYDNETNASNIKPPFDKLVDMTVFDLADFYKQCGFKAGDSLMFKVEDWLKGVFSVRHIPAKGKSVDFAGTHAWVEALRSGFEEMRTIEEPNYDCNEQISHMFCLAEMDVKSSSVLTDPPLTLPDFFRKQSDLTLKTLGQITFFWPIDEPVESRLTDLMEDGGPEPETELDALFQMLNLSLDSEDAEAYMRDALACGINDPNVPLERVLNGRDLLFPNEIIQHEFSDLWHELWDEVRQRFDPKKDSFREARSVILRLNDKCLTILREMDKAKIDPRAIITNPAAMQLSEISGMVHSVMVMLNLVDEDAEEIELPLPLEEMDEKMGAVLDQISEYLLNPDSPDIPKIGDGPVYQLKISLRSSKPPIWRRVLVPSAMPLEILHNIIQITFGWRNCHLHQFIDGRTYYQPGGEDDDFCDMMDVEDSDGLRISDLLCKAKDKIVYEYDFGDSWEHQILLEKVLEPDQKKTLPLCIKGMRACPPEDCGGMYGYYELLETLNGPDCQEKKELLEWAEGPIDPDAFDLVAVNASLRKWI